MMLLMPGMMSVVLLMLMMLVIPVMWMMHVSGWVQGGALGETRDTCLERANGCNKQPGRRGNGEGAEMH